MQYRRFVSARCRFNSDWGINMITLRCEKCKKSFQRKPSDVKRSATGNYFCSRSCSATYNNRLRKSKHVWDCLNCGKTNESRIGRPGKYCSNMCQGEYRRKEIVRKWLSEERVTLPNRSTLEWYYRKSDKYTCTLCGLDDRWNGKIIVLQFDHIDGNYKNNSPQNIRPLCPNCHSQTDTYCNRNMGNGRDIRRERYEKRKKK